jgi:hypothetical protein
LLIKNIVGLWVMQVHLRYKDMFTRTFDGINK